MTQLKQKLEILSFLFSREILKKIFHKLGEIGNNANIGIRGLTT